MINFFKRILGITALELKLARAEELIHDLAQQISALIIHLHRKDRQIIELSESQVVSEKIH